MLNLTEVPAAGVPRRPAGSSCLAALQKPPGPWVSGCRDLGIYFVPPVPLEYSSLQLPPLASQSVILG